VFFLLGHLIIKHRQTNLEETLNNDIGGFLGNYKNQWAIFMENVELGIEWFTMTILFLIFYVVLVMW